MKYCLINNLYPPYARGGAERVVENQARDLKKQGHEVFVITLKPKRGDNQLEKDGVKVYQIWPFNIFSYLDLNKHGFLMKLLWHKIDIFNIWSARKVKKILEQEKPDVVYIHNLMGLGFCIPRMVQKLGIKNIHTLHDVQLVEPSGILLWNHQKDSVWQKIYSYIMKKKMGKPDEIIFPSEFLKNFYLGRGFFANAECRIQNAELKKIRHEAQNTKNKFLFVGQLEKHKGIEILMKVWDDISDKELHIVGDGSLKSEIKKWVENKKNVFVHGRLEKEELEKKYEECDVLIFPSICLENHPTVIAEALEKGLYVIASNTGGVGELINSEKKGILVEPGNMDEFIKTIKSFFE